MKMKFIYISIFSYLQEERDGGAVILRGTHTQGKTSGEWRRRGQGKKYKFVFDIEM